MRTLLDYVGLNPLRPLVAFGGSDSGGGGGGGGGDSRPEKAKALDEPTVSVGYGSGQVDPGLASAVGLAPTGGYSGITGPSAYEISEALGGSDRDPTPAPVPVAQPVVSATSDLNVAPVVDYSDVDLGGLPLLPQEIPVEYKDTTSGIEKVINFYSPPEFGYDLRDPNEPSVLLQDRKPFSGIAFGERYESGQPVGSVSMDNIAGLGELELPDLSLTPATATADLEVGPSLALPTVSAIEPVQTGLEEFEEQQYEAGSPTTVPDYELGLSPEELSDVLTRADAYYGDTGYDEMGIRDAPSSAPLSVAEQVAQYDSDVNLDLRDIGRDLESGKISVADVFSPSLTDDDMGLPDISVDEAMFTRGDLGRSGVVGGTSIPLDPLGLATGLDDDPYSATLADDVVGEVVDEVVDSTPVTGTTAADYLQSSGLSISGQRDPGSVNAAEAALIGDILRNSNIPMDKDRQERIVQTMRDNGATEAQISTFKQENPEGSELYSGDGSFGANVKNVADDVLSFAIKSLTFGIIDPNKMNYDRAQKFLNAYRNTGQFAYDAENPDVVIGVYDTDGSIVSGFGDFKNTEDGAVRVQDVIDTSDDNQEVCPVGYIFDPLVGQCVPIVAEEEVKISLGEVERPVVTTPRPPRPPSEPVEGMTIRAPKQFNVGGPVTPNIDRFLGSLRG